VLVRNGTLRAGDALVIGSIHGRVRTMLNYKGDPIKSAGPATPVAVLGLSGVPEVGERIEVVRHEREARQMAEERSIQARAERLTSEAPARMSLDDLFSQIQEGEVKELVLIVKADVQGSVEAICQSLERLDNEEVHINIIHSGVGAIGKSDVMLAAASNAIIIGFNTTVEPRDRKLAEDEGIEIRMYNIIYDIINDVKAAMLGMLEPEYEEVKLGHAEVLQLFKISRLGTIAGCRVLDGRMVRGEYLRVARHREIVYEGRLDSLKRVKEDVPEVIAPLECGVALHDFNLFQEGDILEAYTLREVPRTLPV
jgi:translation initiation factor IF-2